MRNFPRVIVFLMCLAATVTLASAAEKPSWGGISGSVNFCGLGGLDGMQVYVPGKMYVVITDDSGRFVLHGLPPGRYTLAYRKGDTLLNQNQDIQVLAGQTTALGEIAFCDRRGASVRGAAQAKQETCMAQSQDPQCRDADGDGVPAANDCDDANAKVFPGAVEMCDGLDNNCNGSVDDNVSILVERGMGACKAGAVSILKCDKGYADCDGDVSNGCETDLMSDDENCGGCGNACAATEICSLGFC